MDLFGDRMKFYEKQEAGRVFLPGLPVCARIDGKCFSKFTKGLNRPYDQRMIDLMCDTAAFVLDQTAAQIAYTQSDEISLIWYSDDYKKHIFFNGRIQKMVSVISSMVTAYFNQKLADLIPEKTEQMAFFDCRIWQVPSRTEAANCLLWREFDATKNSVSMAAREFYSHKELYKKNRKEMQDMLWKKGVNWNDYPASFKRGTYIQKQKNNKVFSAEEIDALPEKHAAKTNPNLEYERSEVIRLEMPPLAQVTNREAVIFNGDKPNL